MKLCTAKYEVYMKRIFYRLGLSIGRHPWRYIFGLLFLTFISAFGFLRFHQINNARLTFTASDSPSHTEGRMMEEFLRQNGTLNMIELMIHAKDGGSLLRSEHRQQLFDLTDEIANKITVQDSGGANLTYHEMCEPYCQKNDAFFALLNLFTATEGNASAIELTYPTMDMLGRQVFLASNIYNVTLQPNSTVIKGFGTLLMRYYMTYPTKQPMLDWETKLVELIYDSDKYPLLTGGVGSDNLVALEVRAMGTKTAPLLGIALAVLMAFLALCSFRYKKRESKPIEALLGALIPILSGLTTIGMVSATGLAFQSIVVSTLFLVLAIGIDDIFVILSAWHRTDRSLDIPYRLAETVQEAGCSMTVTSITNLISFANGVLSTTPVLQTFAIYSSVASVICYIYQLIIFPAILAIRAPNEYKKIDDDVCKSSCIPEEIKPIKSASKFHDVVCKSLAASVEKPAMRFGTIIILLGYWYLAGYGIVTMKTDLAIQKMAPPDARIVEFKIDYDKTITEAQTVAILVKHPGDLRQPQRLHDLRKLIHSFEHSSYSYGNLSTFCWLQPYIDFISFYSADGEDENIVFSYTDMSSFLTSESIYEPTLHINETACDNNLPECINSFIFTTGFNTVAKYDEMYPLVQEWRGIAAEYPDFEVYSYTERHNFADQTNDMVSVIWQTVLSEVVCMALSFIIFVPDVVSIAAAVFSLLSVNMGVFGFLSLWDVGMDPVSMASLLMSIGFSVDIGAHISYHYYQVDAPTPREKLQDAYLHIGWPTVQGGMSTALAMMPILVKPSYLGMVFLKTVVLVTVFGLIHGLIVLPVFLSWFTDIFRKFRKCSSCDFPNKSKIAANQIEPHRISIKSNLFYSEKF